MPPRAGPLVCASALMLAALVTLHLPGPGPHHLLETATDGRFAEGGAAKGRRLVTIRGVAAGAGPAPVPPPSAGLARPPPAARKRPEEGGTKHRTIAHDLAASLQEVAINRTVLVTTASQEFALILNNWICHVKRLGITNVIVFALDAPTAEQAASHGVAALLDSTFDKGGGQIGEFSSASYNHAVYAKTKHQLAVLQAGYSLFFSDADIPWTSNWIGGVATFAGDAGVDLVLSTGWPFPDLNTGFFFARPTERTIRVFGLLIELEDAIAAGRVDKQARNSYTHNDGLEKSDQTCLNFLLQCGKPDGYLSTAVSNKTVAKYLSSSEKKHLKAWPWHGRPRGKPWPLMSAFRQTCAGSGLAITYAMLNPQRFQNGHRKYAKSKWARFAYDDPEVMYHGNYLMGAAPKIQAFKDRGRWIEKC